MWDTRCRGLHSLATALAVAFELCDGPAGRQWPDLNHVRHVRDSRGFYVLGLRPAGAPHGRYDTAGGWTSGLDCAVGYPDFAQ